MKIRYFKHTKEGYYFGAFVRWNDTNDILAMLSGKCLSMVEAAFQTGKFLKGWPPVMLIEPMGYTDRDLSFDEIKIPVQKVDNKVFMVPVVIAL